jgi:hypothetical protein
MKSNQAITHWIIDAVLFTSFIILFLMDLTGVELHQWIGLVGGAIAFYHLLEHADWVEAVSRRLFGKTSRRARLYYLLDASLLLGFSAIFISGLGISTWLTSVFGYSPDWVSFHVNAAIVTLAVVLFKLAIHWRWIVSTARKMFPAPRPGAPGRLAPQPAPARIHNDRRDFLKLLGILGAAAAVALINVSNPPDAAEAEQSSAVTNNQATSSNSTTSQAAVSASCASRCPKSRACSYPGQCHSYQDSNGNGRCDLGECA